MCSSTYRLNVVVCILDAECTDIRAETMWFINIIILYVCIKYRCNYIEQSQRHTTNDIHMHTQYLKLLLYRRVCKMFTRLKIIFSWLLVEDELLEYQRTNGKIFGKTAAMAFKYCQTFSITSASLTVGHRCTTTSSSSSCIKNQPKSQHTMQMARTLHTYRLNEMLPDMRIISDQHSTIPHVWHLHPSSCFRQHHLLIALLPFRL